MRSALSGSSCFFLQSTHPHSGHSARGEDRHTLQGGEELEEVDGEGGAGRTTAGGGVGCSPEGPGENRSSFERAPTEADTDMALLTMGSLNHHFKGIDRVTRRDGSSLDSYSKDSYSKYFLADSTDSRVWGLNFESN